MKNIKIALACLLAGLTALWLLADTLFPVPLNYFTLRGVLVQLTGVLAIGAMSAGLLLALRPAWMEDWLNGLDKMYRLHKWLGISALVFGVAHWWLAKGTKWMVGWGWLERPARRAGGEDVMYGVIEGWLRGQRHLAEDLGQEAFYAMTVLIVLALVKRYPYHRFTRSHRWIALVYLVLAWHSLVLAKFAYWQQPVGMVLGALLAAGSLAAVIVLLRRVGSGRKVAGTIEDLTYYPELRVIEAEVALPDGWPGHRAGQFAFVKATSQEGAHPFTIASAWDAQRRRVVFIVKALGDFTADLREHLRIGGAVTVEGPYGRFDFEDGKARQVWVGGGIGITPFIARMKQLALQPGEKDIDLFHTTTDESPAALRKLGDDARAAGIRLHVLVDARDGRLDGARIRATVAGWQEASVWFCGPPAFGGALKADLCAHGLRAADFHQELFQMR